MKYELHHGDCLEVLKTLEDCSVDAIVTDPPAGIAFMNREWDRDKGGKADWIQWMQSVADQCLRVIKPGGHALVWAIPRTSHWTVAACQRATRSTQQTSNLQKAIECLGRQRMSQDDRMIYAGPCQIRTGFKLIDAYFRQTAITGRLVVRSK